MGWDPAVVPDPQDLETFQRSKLKWDEAGEGDHARLLQLYKDLAQLRRNTPELADGGFGETSVEFDDDEYWLQFSRGSVRVVCNFGNEALGTPLTGSVLLATDSEAALEEGTLTLPGGSAAVVRVH